MINSTIIKYVFEDRGNLADLGAVDTATANVNNTPAYKITPTSSGRNYTLATPTDTTRLTIVKIWNSSTSFDFKVQSLDCPANTVTSLSFSGATWQISGGGSSTLAAQSVTASGATALTDWNKIYLCDTTLGSQTLTLPDANVGLGKAIEIFKVSTDVNTVTVVGFAGDTINAIDSLVITVNNEGRNFRATGANSVQMDGVVKSTNSFNPTQSITATGNINATAREVICTGAANLIASLPVSTGGGRVVTVKNKQGAPVHVNVTGGGLIDTGTSLTTSIRTILSGESYDFFDSSTGWTLN